MRSERFFRHPENQNSQYIHSIAHFQIFIGKQILLVRAFHCHQKNSTKTVQMWFEHV